MKTFDKCFSENYVAVDKPCNNKNGFRIEYIYFAPWYLWDISPQSLLPYKYSIGAACLLNVIIFFVASIQKTSLNYSFLVEVPATISLAALIFEVLGVIQFCASKKRMNKPEYEGIDFKLRTSPLLHALLLVLTVLACLYRLIIISFDSLSFFVTIGYLVCAGMSTFVFLRYRTIDFTTEPNRTLEEYNKDSGKNEDKKIPDAK